VGILDDFQAQIRAWLAVEPGLSAQAVLAGLIEASPEKSTAKHLWTIQRAVKAMAWRDGAEDDLGRVLRPLPRTSP
jgi:hypothetical protein